MFAGGAGADRFTLAITNASDFKTIADFTADDEMALLGVVYGLALGALALGAFRNGAAAADANDRIVYNQGTGQVFFDADGNGAGA